jgi:sulfate permease, SulP family
LAAVVIATALSWALGFERKSEIDLAQVAPTEVAEQLATWAGLKVRIEELGNQVRERKAAAEEAGPVRGRRTALRSRIAAHRGLRRRK